MNVVGCMSFCIMLFLNIVLIYSNTAMVYANVNQGIAIESMRASVRRAHETLAACEAGELESYRQRSRDEFFKTLKGF